MIAVVTKIKTTSIAQRFSKERKKHNWKKMRSEKKNRCSRFGLGAHNLANRIHIQLHLPEEICYLSCSSKWLFLRFFFSLSVSFCRSFYSFYLFSLIRFIFFLAAAGTDFVCALLLYLRVLHFRLHLAVLMIMLN